MVSPRRSEAELGPRRARLIDLCASGDEAARPFRKVEDILRHAVLLLFFFFTLVTGPRRSLRLKLSDTRVYEPQKRATSVEEEDRTGVPR